ALESAQQGEGRDPSPLAGLLRLLGGIGAARQYRNRERGPCQTSQFHLSPFSFSSPIRPRRGNARREGATITWPRCGGGGCGGSWRGRGAGKARTRLRKAPRA